MFKLGLTVVLMALKDPQTVPVKDEESGWEDPVVPPDPAQNDLSDAYTSSESELHAPEEVHVAETRKGTKGGGQNKKLDPAIGVPTPPFRLYKGDATNPAQRFKPFCNYWNGLPQWAKDRALMYIYREHPVLLYVEKDPEGKQKDFEFNYIDKISGAEPLQDEADLLNRYGCGNYKLVFNVIETGKPNRTLCTVYATNIGGGDFKSNPPTDRRISDVKNVDLNYPSNASYVAFLRGQGLLPNQIDAIRGEQDMASIELVKEQTTTTNKLVDALIDKSKEKAPAQDPSFMEKAVSGAMEVVKEGSKAAIKITQDANEYANRVREKADQAAPVVATESPLALALQIVELMKGGAGSGDAEVIALRAQIDKLRDDQVSILRDELKAMRESRAVSSSTNPFDYMKSGMEALRGMKTTIDEITGGPEKGATGIEEAVESAGVPKWVTQIAMPLVGQIAQAAQGYFNMRTAQNMPPGQPLPPGYVPPQNPGFPSPAPQWPPQTHTTAPAPTPGGPQLVQARHPLATLDYTQFTPELTQLLTAIATPLNIHLTENDTGTAFAEWFMTGFGEDTHVQIAGFGLEGVVAALYSFPPTLQAIQQFPVEKVQGFVAEFLNPQFEPGTEEGEDKVVEVEPEIPA